MISNDIKSKNISHGLKKGSILRFFLRIILFFLIIIVGIAILVFGYNAFFAHKIYPGVYLSNIHVYNKSYSDVYNFLESQSRTFLNQGIDYKYEDYVVSMRPIISTLDDPDLAYELVKFDNASTAKEVFTIGRYLGYKSNILKQFEILFLKPCQVFWQYDFNEEEWKSILKDNFSQFEIPFQPPSIEFSRSNIIISESVDGKEFDYKYITEYTQQRIDYFDFSPISLELKEIKSPITLEQANEKKDLIKDIANLGSITLNYNKRFWRINSAIYKDWLILKLNNDEEVIISFDFEKYKEHMDEYVTSYINKESRNAKFEIQNGRVTKFQGSQDGQSVNLEQSLELIETAINNLENEVDLAVEVTKAEVETQNVNDLGIKEIIGIGESDFRGSPFNRVHNIKTGTRALNGILIAPGKEFSTIQNLLPVNASTGYLQELVIKGNKTIPEYGGGLCQIGTTMFRAAIQSGLKITERRPHSYRVVYYEPAGVDAAVYDPHPDMRFINDTQSHILIQSYTVGTKLYFEFWGARDGRKIAITDSIVYNIKSPGPTQEIETEDLEPGERKCTESAHAGADAYFDYKVEYADDRETYEERIISHYVPWSAVCLIGVEKVSTSTEEIIEE